MQIIITLVLLGVLFLLGVLYIVVNELMKRIIILEDEMSSLQHGSFELGKILRKEERE